MAYKFEDLRVNQSPELRDEANVELSQFFGKTKFSKDIEEFFSNKDVIKEISSRLGFDKAEDEEDLKSKAKMIDVHNIMYDMLDENFELTLLEVLNAVAYVTNNANQVIKKVLLLGVMGNIKESLGIDSPEVKDIEERIKGFITTFSEKVLDRLKNVTDKYNFND